MYSITLLRSLVDSLIKQTQNSRTAITSSGLNDVVLSFEMIYAWYKHTDDHMHVGDMLAMSYKNLEILHD